MGETRRNDPRIERALIEAMDVSPLCVNSWPGKPNRRILTQDAVAGQRFGGCADDLGEWMYPGPMNTLVHGTFHCNLPVETVATLTPWQAHRLLAFEAEGSATRRRAGGDPWAEGAFRFRLDYPLSKAFVGVVEPGIMTSTWSDCAPQQRTFASAGYLAWAIAKAHLDVYEQHETYGVWGHEISDLYIESLKIENGEVFVSIGS